MSTETPYASDPNSPRWPFYAMVLFAFIICVTYWRSCSFSGSSVSDAPAVAAAPAPAAPEAH